MGRKVFSNDVGNERANTPSPDRSARKKRKPLVKVGVASERYIHSAAAGAADRSYQDIHLDQIRQSSIQDRINLEEDLDSLVESIRSNGQQIPIILRIVEGEQPYEIVAGRRRLAAAKILKLPTIRAFVSKMDAREAFITQGIENAERLETSFIERARAATQARDAGFSNDDVAEFLGSAKSLVSMMYSIFSSIGEELVRAIGPARGVGRRKWEVLSDLIENSQFTAVNLAHQVNQNLDSVDRFEDLMKRLEDGMLSTTQEQKPPAPPKAQVSSQKHSYMNGALSTIRKPGQLVLKTKGELSESMLDQVQSFIETMIKEEAKNNA